MNTQVISAKQWFIRQDLVTFLIKVALGANVIALLAQLSIPMYPVPITGQTLGVTLVGFALGRNAGISAVLLYLFEGAIGLPVFANFASGYAVLAGPTGGYLIGFVLAAAILGHFSDKGVLKNFWASFAVALLATVVLFAVGLIQLSFFVPEGTVFQYGLYPFILGGVIKALLAAALVIPVYRFFAKI